MIIPSNACSRVSCGASLRVAAKVVMLAKTVMSVKRHLFMGGFSLCACDYCAIFFGVGF